MDEPSSAEAASYVVFWSVVLVALLVWWIRAARQRHRERRARLNSPGHTWRGPAPYPLPYAGQPWPLGATAEGSRCPCGAGHRVYREGEFGPFLGCSTWIDPERGCQRACSLDGRALPPTAWRRNRRPWSWSL